MAHDIFISYSSQDKAVADAVCASLETRKIRCWIAPRDVLPGIPYGEAIIDGISQSRILVLVFSTNSNNSPQVMREIERAVHKGIPIIPLRIDEVIPTKAMEYFVSASHWLDAMTPPLERHLQKLGDTIQVLLSSETGEAPEIGPKPAIQQPAKKRPWWKMARGAPIIGLVLVITIIIVGLKFGLSGDKTSPGTVSTNTSLTTSTGAPPTTSAGPSLVTATSASPTTATGPSLITPASTTTPSLIPIELLINDARAIVISDPSGDVADSAPSKKGADLKSIWALMEGDYLYVAMQFYDSFDALLIRNYFAEIDINNDWLLDYSFGVRPYDIANRGAGKAWALVYGRTTKSDWDMIGNLEASDIIVSWKLDSGLLEMAIPRKAYNISDNVLVKVRVTDGTRDLDSMNWFKVTLAKAK